MVSLDILENLVVTKDCIILCLAGRVLCGCGKQFAGLAGLSDHIAHNHVKTEPTEEPARNLQEYFRKNFSFPQDDKSAVTVILPQDITCVCLTEHDIGAFAANLYCHLCNYNCEDMDMLNKHMTEIHKVSQVLVGQNIIFEKPDASHVKPAFYCPMVKCKYHIAESEQVKYFKTFKLLKQHYTKVHASKDNPCDKCDQKFASKTYLDIHLKSCGKTFACQCGAKFPAFESLQTHCRRKAHPVDPAYLKVKPAPAQDPLYIAAQDLAGDRLAIIQSHSTGPIPIAPRPSAMHVNAAIALSELSASHLFTPKADIGIQTDSDFLKARKSCTPDNPLVSPGRRSVAHSDSLTAVSAETQTRSGSRKRPCRPYKVSSLVQTMGEFTVKAKKARTDPGVAMGSQCRISPAKKVPVVSSKNTVTTMTSLTSQVADQTLSCHMQVDIPDFEDLWPLKCNTNGTQTSPRVAQLGRKLSLDSVEELAMPVLENVSAVADPTLSQLEHQQAAKPPPLGQTRQFSTETQTELNIFLDSSDWGDCVGTGRTDNELPDVEKLLTTEMETQTHEGDDDLLLFANNCTQTGGDDFLSALLGGGGRDNSVTPFKLEYVCSAETQTSLTGFQGHNLLHQVMGQGEAGNNHIETQTQEMMDFMGM